jgi:hypothetical protein
MLITAPDFPGEQLVGCVNPHLEAERARRPLRGTDKIAARADRVLNRRKVAKHFTVDIGEDHVRYARNQDSIAAEAKLDGIYQESPMLGNGRESRSG